MVGAELVAIRNAEKVTTLAGVSPIAVSVRFAVTVTSSLIVGDAVGEGVCVTAGRAANKQVKTAANIFM